MLWLGMWGIRPARLSNSEKTRRPLFLSVAAQLSTATLLGMGLPYLADRVEMSAKGRAF